MNSLPIIGNILVPILSPLITSLFGSGPDNRELSLTAVFMIMAVAFFISLGPAYLTWWAYRKIYGTIKFNPIRLRSKEEAVYARNVKLQSFLAGVAFILIFLLNVLGVVHNIGVK